MNCVPSFPSFVFEERLRFEIPLTELPARFVNATESIGAEIVNARNQIVRALDLDRSTPAQLHEPDGLCDHLFLSVPGVEPWAGPGLVAKDIPWLGVPLECREKK